MKSSPNVPFILVVLFFFNSLPFLLLSEVPSPQPLYLFFIISGPSDDKDT